GLAANSPEVLEHEVHERQTVVPRVVPRAEQVLGRGRAVRGRLARGPGRQRRGSVPLVRLGGAEGCCDYFFVFGFAFIGCALAAATGDCFARSPSVTVSGRSDTYLATVTANAMSPRAAKRTSCLPGTSPPIRIVTGGPVGVAAAPAGGVPAGVA